MNLQNILSLLFVVTNTVSILLLLGSYAFCIIARVRKSKLSTARVPFPDFSDQHTLVSYCHWCGILFALLNWLLCSSKILYTDGSTNNPLVALLLLAGIAWAVMFLLGIIAEVVIRCHKYSGSPDYSVLAGVKSSVWYAVCYFVLAFLFK